MNNQKGASGYLTLLKIRTDARRTMNRGEADNRERKVYLAMLERSIERCQVKLPTVQG
jgi:hypothetical protein